MDSRSLVASSIYSEPEGWERDDRKHVRPATRLTPLVMNGVFQDFEVGNPYLKKPQIPKYEFSEAHLKVLKYESYFNRKLQRLAEIRRDLKMDKDVEMIMFYGLHSFTFLSDHFIVQLKSFSGGRSLRDMLQQHLNKFHKSYASFLENLQDLVFGFGKLKVMFPKQLKNIELEDELFQYPIQYVDYYKFLDKELELELELSLFEGRPKDLGLQYQVPETVIGEFDRVVGMVENMKPILIAGTSVVRYLSSMYDLTRTCQTLNESIIDPDSQMTPSSEKFLINANKSVYDFVQMGVIQRHVFLAKLWMTLVNRYEEISLGLKPFQSLKSRYRDSMRNSSKAHMVEFKTAVQLQRVLTLNLPRATQLMYSIISLSFEAYKEVLRQTFQELSGACHCSDNIIMEYRKDMELKKLVILDASHQGRKVLKYNYNLLQNDTVPLSPSSSIVMNKFFQLF